MVASVGGDHASSWRSSTPVPVAEAFREAADASYPGTGENGYGARPLMWSSDGASLLVGSEASGFVHILAINASGDVGVGTNSSRDLTPLPCEHQGWTHGGAQYIFSAHSCGLGGDVLSVSRIDLRSGERVDVTDATDAHSAAGLSSSGEGMVAVEAGGGVGATLAFLMTAHNASTTVALWHAHSRAEEGRPEPPTIVTRDVLPPAFAKFLRPRLVTFPSLDGTATLHAQLFAVPTANGSPLGDGNVAAIFTHGGSQRQMYGAMHFSQVYAQFFALCQQLALAGVPVLSVNYRSGVGYGRAYRLCGPPEGPPLRRCGSLGALEYDDVRAARSWLRQLARPPGKVGIFGLSYGGLNCLQAMSRDPADYAAGVCSAPVFNWISQLRFDGDTRFDPAPRLPSAYHQLPVGPEPTLTGPDWLTRAQQLQQVASASSPVSHMDNITGPLLLIHGDLDQEVAYQESLSLARYLRRRGKAKVETLLFPDECHGECAYENQLVALSATVSFLRRHLL